MPRYVTREGGEFGLDFDQRYQGLFPDELGPGVVAQALLVAAERRRRVEIPAETPGKPQLMQKRQSRITAALDGADPKFSYRPVKSDHPDVGVRFDRENAAESLAGRGLDSRPTLTTARHRKTTIPLFGQPPLEPTHRLMDLNVPFETMAVALIQTPSEFKLEMLTNRDGGLVFKASIEYYQAMLAQRLAAEIQPAEPGAETGPSTETKSSEDLLPEIPWIA